MFGLMTIVKSASHVKSFASFGGGQYVIPKIMQLDGLNCSPHQEDPFIQGTKKQ